jgi:hypothetical protein
MTTWASVACAEEYGTIAESFDLDGGMSNSVTLRCAWADRYDLLADIIEGRRGWPYGSLGPVAAQAFSGSCRPAQSEFVGFGQGCVYSEALVTINYSTKIKDLVSETLEPTAEFLTLDYKLFRWTSLAGDVLQENEAPGQLQRGLNLVRKNYRLATIPNTVLTAIGLSNATAYTSALLGNMTFPEETLLYQPPTLDRTITLAGTEGFNLTTKFTFKPQGWNKFWRSKTQAYEEIIVAETGVVFKPYPPGNFGSLLA